MDKSQKYGMMRASEGGSGMGRSSTFNCPVRLHRGPAGFFIAAMSRPICFNVNSVRGTNISNRKSIRNRRSGDGHGIQSVSHRQ